MKRVKLTPVRENKRVVALVQEHGDEFELLDKVNQVYLIRSDDESFVGWVNPAEATFVEV